MFPSLQKEMQNCTEILITRIYDGTKYLEYYFSDFYLLVLKYFEICAEA